MPGKDQQQQTQSQNTVTQPWAPAQPLLQKLIDSYGGLSTGVTGAQDAAAGNLVSSASAIPNFGGAGAGALKNLFTSSTAPQVGMLTDAFSKLNTNIGGTASGAELDPYATPGFGDALQTMTRDITNNVKGVYAGSGRDPSGAGSFGGNLARKLTEGISPVIASQFNTNKSNQMNAAQQLFNAGNTTAGAITGQNQVPLANAAQALGLVPQATSAYTAPGMAQLGAANAQYQLPWANLAQLLSPATGIAGLGGQSTGSGTATTVQPQNTFSNVLGGISGGVGLLSLLSDERAKDNIEEVGKLHDGQPVFRYTYKEGGPAMHIGLLAQRVARRRPRAVSHMGGGMLGVDYRMATQGAVRKAA